MKFFAALAAVLGILCVYLYDQNVKLARSLLVTEYQYYMEQTSTYKMMMGGLCRLNYDKPEQVPEFCVAIAKDDARKDAMPTEYLKWYAKEFGPRPELF